MGNSGPKLKSLLGQFRTQAKVPFRQFGTQAKVPFGQFGTQAKAKVLLFLSVRVVFIFTFLRGIQEFQTILHSLNLLVVINYEILSTNIGAII